MNETNVENFKSRDQIEMEKRKIRELGSATSCDQEKIKQNLKLSQDEKLVLLTLGVHRIVDALDTQNILIQDLIQELQRNRVKSEKI